MGKTFKNVTLRVEHSGIDGWQWFLYGNDNPHTMPRSADAILLDSGTGYHREDCLARGTNRAALLESK